jgi:hypothetical protein
MKKRVMITGLFFFVLSAVCFPFAAVAVDEGVVDEMDFKLRTTGDLYDLCSVKPDNSTYYIAAHYGCRGFIGGAVQYHDGVSDRKNLKRLICYPKGTTVGEGIQAFLTWAEKHRNDKELMEELPVVGLVRALADKYPCSQ